MKKEYIFCLLLAVGIFITGFADISLSQRRTSTRRQATRTSASSKRAANTSAKRAATSGRTSSKRAATNGRTSASAKRAAVGGTSSKRAATSSSSARRAATGGTSARRAATSSSVSTKRAMSRGVSKRTASAQTSAPKTANMCPINKLIKKVSDDNGNDTYYSAKNTTCAIDENVEVIQWNRASREDYPLTMYTLPSWLSEADAYYLICRNGYVEDEVDGKSVCVPYLDICPLNETITKEGNDYIHPGKTAEADNTCRPLKKAKLKLLSKEEYDNNPDLRREFAYDDINIFECPENSYSESSNYPGIADVCKSCPYMINGERVYAPQGSTEKAACRPACKDENGLPVKKVSVKVGDAYVCKPCDENGATFQNNLCKVKSGYTCYESGTRCEKTLYQSDCDANATLDSNKCICNSGWIGDGLKSGDGCHKECGANATMNMSDYSCKCNAGYQGDVYAGCELIPNITSADCVDGATFANGKCNCPSGTFGDGLKDNNTSPYCKIMGANDPLCKNTYANGQGTAIPRGCIATCATGTYWGE